MSPPRHLSRFMKMAIWCVVGFVGVFMPTYIVGGMIWCKALGKTYDASPSAQYFLGAIAVFYISMWPALLLSATLYASVITSMAQRLAGRQLMLFSLVAAFILPVLTVLLRVDRSMIENWPAAVVSTALFGLFCGQVLRTRIVDGTPDQC